MQPWTYAEMAQRILREIPTGAYVNIGIGLPTTIVRQINPEQQLTFHAENGLLGYTALTDDAQADPEAIDAASQFVNLVPGSAIVAHDVSFAIARGGRLYATVLGAYQVSETGDLANWALPGTGLAGIGGAMDLAAGAQHVYVMMRHTERDGSPKLRTRCTYPLTAPGCVTGLATEYAYIRVTHTGLEVMEMAPGVTLDFLQTITEPELRLAESIEPPATTASHLERRYRARQDNC